LGSDDLRVRLSSVETFRRLHGDGGGGNGVEFATRLSSSSCCLGLARVARHEDNCALADLECLGIERDTMVLG